VVNASSRSTHYVHARVLRFNVGYLLAASIGVSRQTTIDVPQALRIAEDLIVNDLHCRLNLTRTSQGVWVQGEADCGLTQACTRCLTQLEPRYHLTLEELFSLIPRPDIQFSVGEDDAIDLAPLIREEVLVSLPTQLLCQAECRGLCMECGHNLNEGPCTCQTQPVDPRWQALIDLQDKFKSEN